MIDFSLLNGVVNVSTDGVFYKGFQQSSDNTSDFNVDSNEAIITLDGQPFVIPLSNLTISGVAVTNQADFETKISVILNNVTSSIQTAINTATKNIKVVADETAALADLANGQYGLYLMTGQDPTWYAKNSTGTQFKLTLPAL